MFRLQAPYRSDDSMAIVAGHEVLYPSGLCCCQVIPSYEMGWKIVFCSVRACMPVDQRDCDTIGVRNTICLESDHSGRRSARRRADLLKHPSPMLLLCSNLRLTWNRRFGHREQSMCLVDVEVWKRKQEHLRM